VAAPAQREDTLAAVRQAAAAGDARATRTLIRELQRSMHAVARAVLGNDHPDVDDVLQDAALGLVLGLQRFRGESSIAYYAHRITLRTALRAGQRSAARRQLAERVAMLEVADWETLETAQALAMTNRRRAVVRALARLKPEVADTFMLHVILGHTVEEIVELRQITIGTVLSRIRTAKQQLRRMLRHMT